jgi:hypothetical protein
MGEYAYRVEDGEEVKIGTCENMYYIRYEDRFRVTKAEHSLDCSSELNLRWRLPFPDEDHIKIGEYWDYERSSPLFGYIPEDANDLGLRPYDFKINHDKCYHSYKTLPIGLVKSNVIECKDYFFELAFIKNTEEGLKAIIRCCGCREMWKVDIKDILPYVYDLKFKKKLEKYLTYNKIPQLTYLSCKRGV